MKGSEETVHPGWDWWEDRKAWVRGSAYIYPVNGEFVVSSDDVWLPGSFSTFEAAEGELSAR